MIGSRRSEPATHESSDQMKLSEVLQRDPQVEPMLTDHALKPDGPLALVASESDTASRVESKTDGEA